MVTWFVHNPVAANLFMLVLLAGGLVVSPAIPREEFPSIDSEMVRVSVVQRGASPEDVEESVCIRIEEVIEGTQDVDRIRSIAVEGACTVTVELVTGSDTDRALDEIKNRVDAIDTFPAEAERPVVSRLVMRNDVIRVAISGATDPVSLKVLGQRIRDEIVALPGVSQADLNYALPWEISIEVSEESLRRHGLTLGEVADAVRRSALDVPGGSVRTRDGEILLRTIGQVYRGEEFESIAVMTRADGTTLTLGEIASVVDGFEEGDLEARFQGRPAVTIDVKRVGDEDILDIASRVLDYVENVNVPDGIVVTTFSNEADELDARLGALTGNARSGLVLVLLILGLFLRFRLAMWVAAGVPIAFCGALAFFPAFGLTISTLSIMAFILVLGILVDDAIVVGEAVYSHERHAEDQVHAAVNGTLEVHVPVVFGVMTTVAAFLPMVLVPGRMGQMFSVLGIAAILCLLFSLIESQLILPAHLAHRRLGAKRGRSNPVVELWTDFQERLSTWLENFTRDGYGAWLSRAIEWRYTVLAGAVGILILMGALFAGGYLRYQFFPAIAGDEVRALLTLPPGTPVAYTREAVSRLEASAEELRGELDRDRDGPSAIRFVLSSIGRHQTFGGPQSMQVEAGGAHLAEVYLDLLPGAERKVASDAIADRWRELTGPIPDALDLTFTAVAFSAGDPIDIQLKGGDVATLARAAEALEERLSTYPGVRDLSDSFRGGKQELKLALRPEARTLGLSMDDLGRQVRQAFYGEEVQRLQRGRDDVRVMVRYPGFERRSLGDLEEMRIRTADGAEVPIASVATVSLGRGFSSIRRTDRERVVSIRGDVDRAVATPEAILEQMVADMPMILAAFPGVTYSLEGEQREHGRALGGLVRAFGLALFVIYVLLAIPLRSYTQPFVIMSVIPFGTVGAVFGHLIMGWDILFFSILGMVALSGVVVNASLVLVHFVNTRREAGRPMVEAVREAGVARFRPIFLTSLTTFIGLVPLMFESNPAAFMVIPMAISLAFGVAIASVFTLFLVPCLYAILEDIQNQRARRAVSGAPAISQVGGQHLDEALQR